MEKNCNESVKKERAEALKVEKNNYEIEVFNFDLSYIQSFRYLGSYFPKFLINCIRGKTDSICDEVYVFPLYVFHFKYRVLTLCQYYPRQNIVDFISVCKAEETVNSL